MGLYEIMTMSPSLRRLVHAEAEDGQLRDQAFKDGMKPLRVSGAMKVAQGVTTTEEVLKVAPVM
jgi:general secretion pathway protein E